MNTLVGDFIVKEWLLLLTLIGLFVSSYYVGALPVYTSNDLIPIFLLFSLFIVIKGIENSNLLLKIAVTLGSE